MGGEFWESVGLSPAERALYERLLRSTTTDVTEHANALGITEPEAERLVGRLTELRLVQVASDGVEALDPGSALFALTRRRELGLEQLQAVLEPLRIAFEQGRRSTDADADPRLRALRAKDASRLATEALQGATRTVDAFVTPPIATTDAVDDIEFDALRRGVHIRTILSAAAFLDPRLRRNLETAQALGEEVRVEPNLAVKLLIVDRSRFIVPVVGGNSPDGVRAVTGDYPELVSVLQNYFDSVWERASPVTSTADDGPTHRPTSSHSPVAARDADDNDVLDLLALGMTDSTICRTLRISDRTLRRRVAALQAHFGVQSRYQLGMAVAQSVALSHIPPLPR